MGENRSLKAQLAALQWMPITPENLPKVGDEVLVLVEGRYMVENVLEPLPLKRHRFTAAKRNGWTHFRSIAPPESSGVQGKENAS
jgi:hypothetical protein